MDPADISPEASPDCANAFLYEGKKSLMGPRFGRAYAGLAEQRIMGAFPYRVGGKTGLLVAMSDGRTVFLDSYTGQVPGGSLSAAQLLAVVNQTIVAGPVAIQLNQFAQIINLFFNNVAGAAGQAGINGFTGGGTLCLVHSFNAANCTFTYTKIVYQFDRGICVLFTVTTEDTCTSSPVA